MTDYNFTEKLAGLQIRSAVQMAEKLNAILITDDTFPDLLDDEEFTKLIAAMPPSLFNDLPGLVYYYEDRRYAFENWGLSVWAGDDGIVDCEFTNNRPKFRMLSWEHVFKTYSTGELKACMAEEATSKVAADISLVIQALTWAAVKRNSALSQYDILMEVQAEVQTLLETVPGDDD